MKRGNRFIDRVGHKYGSMTVQKHQGFDPKNGEALWECLCDCGKTVIKAGGNLAKVKTCGNTCTSVWNNETPFFGETNSIPYGVVYKLTNKTNGKIYIGQTIFSLDTRWKKHVDYAKRGGEGFLQNAIRLCGEDAFNREVVAHARNKEQLDELEKFYICSLNSLDDSIGYNLTWRPTRSDEGRLKTSQKQLRHLNHFYRDDLKNEELVQMYKDGLSMSEIARRLNCDRKTITYRFGQLGIISILQPNQKDIPTAELIEEYANGASMETLAKKHNVSRWVINNRLTKAGIEVRQERIPTRNDVKTEDLVAAYLSGTKISELSRIHKMDRKTVRDRLKQAGYTHSNKFTNCRRSTSETN